MIMIDFIGEIMFVFHCDFHGLCLVCIAGILFQQGRCIPVCVWEHVQKTTKQSCCGYVDNFFVGV